MKGMICLWQKSPKEKVKVEVVSDPLVSQSGILVVAVREGVKFHTAVISKLTALISDQDDSTKPEMVNKWVCYNEGRLGVFAFDTEWECRSHYKDDDGSPIQYVKIQVNKEQ